MTSREFARDYRTPVVDVCPPLVSRISLVVGCNLGVCTPDVASSETVRSTNSVRSQIGEGSCLSKTFREDNVLKTFLFLFSSSSSSKLNPSNILIFFLFFLIASTS